VVQAANERLETALVETTRRAGGAAAAERVPAAVASAGGEAIGGGGLGAEEFGLALGRLQAAEERREQLEELLQVATHPPSLLTFLLSLCFGWHPHALPERRCLLHSPAWQP
jgi:hypothetical protein